MAEQKDLFREFSPVSSQEWREKIEKDLKGKPYEELVRQTTEGFDIHPFYTSEALQPLEIPFSTKSNDWQIRQDFFAEDPEKANKAILTALEQGSGAIGLRLKEVLKVEQLEILFQDIHLAEVPVHFFTADITEDIFKNYVSLIGGKNLDVNKLSGSFDLDPLCGTEDPDYVSLATLLSNIHEQLPKFKALTIHSQPIHMKNKSVTDELSEIFNKLNTYRNNLSTNNHQLLTIASQIQFSVPIGTNFFMEIAKLRALRYLWQDWQKQNGIEQPVPAFIQAQKSWRCNDKEYPYHNILMHTTEAMAAIIGGCDVLNLRSIDKTEQLDNDLFERISRNIQLILKYESNLDKVVDPAKGSYYVELLTRNLVENIISANALSLKDCEKKSQKI